MGLTLTNLRISQSHVLETNELEISEFHALAAKELEDFRISCA